MLSEGRRGKTTSLRSEPLLSLLKLSRLGAASVLREMGADCRLSVAQPRLWYLHSTIARTTMTTSSSVQPDITHTNTLETTGPSLPLVCPAPELESVRKQKIKVRNTERAKKTSSFVEPLLHEDPELGDGLLWLSTGHFSGHLDQQS